MSKRDMEDSTVSFPPITNNHKNTTNPSQTPVLINNAAIASNPSDSADHTDFRSTYNAILNTNLTSVALLTTLSMPLLSRSPNPRVINISSARASIHNITINNLPPTACVPYSVSKVALNALTLEMGKMYPDVVFYAANPGHCKTALNGFKGKKDPVEGARVVFELVLAKKGRYAPGFWECEGDGMREMKW
jgi:NAD(P)-dependent dehydrogenase (short-subunit alcohol dehydrogenase family)